MTARPCRFPCVRVIVWVGIGILAVIVLLIGVLVFIGLIRQFQIARTRRELERMGYVVSVPYAPETRPIWPRLVAGFAALFALIVTTSVLTADAIGSNGCIECRLFVPGRAEPRYRRPARHEPRLRPPRIAAPDGVAGRASPSVSDLVGVTGGGCRKRRRSAFDRSRSPTSATAIRLEWAPVSDAAGYDIERSTDSVAWNAVASTDGGRPIYRRGAVLRDDVLLPRRRSHGRPGCPSPTSSLRRRPSTHPPRPCSSRRRARPRPSSWSGATWTVNLATDRAIAGRNERVDRDRYDRPRRDLLHGYRLGLCDHVLLPRRRRDVGR